MKSNSESYGLNIRSASAGPFLKIKLFDASDQLIASNYEHLSLRLPKGLYTVKSEIDGITGEEIVIRLDSDKELVMKSPSFSSSALIDGYNSSPEYQIRAAVHESPVIRTDLSQDAKASGSLFLFYRFSAKEELSPGHWNFCDNIKLSLMDHKQRPLTELGPDEAVMNQEMGWMAFNLIMPIGTYYLKDESDFAATNVTVLHVFKNHQTQYFCLLDAASGLPKHHSARCFVSEGPYKSNTDEVKLTDILYRKLMKQDKDVGDFLIQQNFKQAPWNNPMIILLSLYLYSLGEKKEHETAFKDILKQYQKFIGTDDMDSDLECIRLNEGLMNINRQGINIPPPMICKGVKILARCSTTRPGCLADKNPIHEISRRMLPDCVVTTFRGDPQTSVRKTRTKQRAISSGQENPLTERLNNDWVTASVIEMIGKSRVIHSSLEAARRLGVTDRALSETMKQIARMMKNRESEKALKSFMEHNQLQIDYEEFRKNMRAFR